MVSIASRSIHLFTIIRIVLENWVLSMRSKYSRIISIWELIKDCFTVPGLPKTICNKYSLNLFRINKDRPGPWKFSATSSYAAITTGPSWFVKTDLNAYQTGPAAGITSSSTLTRHFFYRGTISASIYLKTNEDVS